MHYQQWNAETAANQVKKIHFQRSVVSNFWNDTELIEFDRHKGPTSKSNLNNVSKRKMILAKVKLVMPIEVYITD